MKKIRTLSLAAAALIILSGCTVTNDSPDNNQLADGPNVLRVLAGSEVKDMQPIIDSLKAETGVQVVFDYTGTLEGTQSVASGVTTGKYDATWFPSNRYLTLLDGGSAAVKHEEKIMSSPVVLGVKQEVAANLGWDSVSPTWTELVTAVKDGKLTYGMTSPVSSNSGFSTLIEAATALSGTGTVLTSEDVNLVAPTLEDFFKGQNLTSGSSGWLADKFTESPDSTDGIFNYESVLKGLKVDGKPLTLITPSDGVITADYPLSLLTSAAPEKQALYDKVTDYLLQDSVQEKISQTTLRRTKTSVNESTNAIFELPFPNQLETVQTLISSYLSKIKNPSDMVFAIDTSGSMGGDRINELKAALTTMTDTSNTGNSFIAFQNRESINYLEFASGIKSDETFDVREATRDADLAKIGAYVNGLNATGGTAVYDTMQASYKSAVQMQASNPDGFTSIVLFTDGESNEGSSFADFQNYYSNLVSTNPEAGQIPTYVVLFGEGNVQELTELSQLTGGKSFNAKDSGLIEIFKEIRGYQ